MPLDVALLLPMLLIAVTVHEFAHAWSASLLGDDFARRQGRVSLNPARHLTPLGTLAIFFIGFGWGRPVPVNLYNFKHPKRDYLLTSLAGPLANIIVAACCVALMHVTRHTYRYGTLAQPMMGRAHQLLELLALINVILATINLLPIPPLDGSKIWPCLIPGLKPSFGKKTTWIFVIVLVAMLWTNSFAPLMRFVGGATIPLMPPSDEHLFHEHMHKGTTAAGANKFAGAERCYSSAITINPGSADAWYSRAIARSYQDNWQGACDDLTRAIELDKTNASYYDLRASLLDALDRPDEADDDRATAAKLGQAPDPNETPATAPANQSPQAKPAMDIDPQCANLLSLVITGDVDFDQAPLRDVLDFLSNVGGVEISVDWQALEKIGVLPDTEIDYRQKNMTLSAMLKDVLQSTGKAADLVVTGKGNKIFLHTRAGGREPR